MGKSDVQHALEKIARLQEEDGIPYAIIGAMALNAYGYRRLTANLDVLLNPEGFEKLNAKGLPDTENGVPIHFILTGEYPGDGRLKPVVFPDPAVAAVRGERVALLPLLTLIELKLASGISAPHRLKDLADVLELVRILDLPEETAEDLHPYVREKYREIWRAAQGAERE